MLKPVIQNPRYRLVADQIAILIRNGVLPAGTKMPPDRDLVEKLRVSRTTVREAMIALELMGYVVTRFGAGAYVSERLPNAGFDGQGMPGYFELVEARHCIEPQIAALATRTIGRADISFLRDCIATMVDPTLSFAEIEASDRAFHLAIARSTSNSVFIGIVEDFWRSRLRFPEWTRTNSRQSVEDVSRFFGEEHTAIVDGFEAQDSERAARAMQVHCRNSGKVLLERWSSLNEEIEPGEDAVLDRMADWKV